MLRLEYQILIAFAVDCLFGDPRWLPHPVRGIGWLAHRLEAPTRRLIRHQRTAGVVAWLGVVGTTGAVAWGLIHCTARLHPLAGDIVAIALMWTTIAARDLVRHSHNVYRALADNDLPEARRRVGMIVGRDTAQLDEAGITRAAVESVAESTVDGVTAPLFFAVLFGPVGAMAYRAINTLDSTFGYKDERYLHFGWASARLDDLANWLPARISAPVMALAAALCGLRPGNAWRIFRRDGRKHESPNAGLCEACMAGALGVQLGGANFYEGEILEKPTLGDPLQPLTKADIRRANCLMYATTLLFLAIGLALRWVVCSRL